MPAGGGEAALLVVMEFLRIWAGMSTTAVDVPIRSEQKGPMPMGCMIFTEISTNGAWISTRRAFMPQKRQRASIRSLSGRVITVSFVEEAGFTSRAAAGRVTDSLLNQWSVGTADWV